MVEAHFFHSERARPLLHTPLTHLGRHESGRTLNTLVAQCCCTRAQACAKQKENMFSFKKAPR